MVATPSGYPVLSQLSLGPWYIREQIGTGSTCTVWRSYSSNPAPKGTIGAVKIVTMSQSQENGVEGKKLEREVKIMRGLKSRWVLECHGYEKRDSSVWNGVGFDRGLYIAMQLATGGDLFDMIPPDHGLLPALAHTYFFQLVQALKYIHSQGVCHRDIKPENILLDGRANLKVSDFGLASVWKYKGQERKLTDRCGSAPYAAPELAKPHPYDAPPIDIWSAGVVFFALLVGNTPWDEPTRNSPEFAAYLDGSIWGIDPWTRFTEPALRTLLKGILNVDPAARLTIDGIERSTWMMNMQNPYIDWKTGQIKNATAVQKALAGKMAETGFLGQPTQGYKELCGALEGTSLEERDSNMDEEDEEGEMRPPPSQSQRLLEERHLDAQNGFKSTMMLYSLHSQTATQRGNSQHKKFFTAWPVAEAASTLSHHLTSLLKDVLIEPIQTTPSIPAAEVQPQSQSYTYMIKFKFISERKEELSAYLTLKPGYLSPVLVQELIHSGGGEGLPDETLKEGVKGVDVVVWKRRGSPITLLRVWRELLVGLPRGLVLTT
ncbi:kinase-like protein [Meredithblackwellia eburnea MCA 4105]